MKFLSIEKDPGRHDLFVNISFATVTLSKLNVENSA